MRRTLIALAIAGLAFAVVTVSAAAPPPLPTTQNVNVVNTPSVTVANTVVPVEVSNADPIPVVDSKSITPLDVRVRFDRDAGCLVNCTNFQYSTGTINFDLPAVPAGKRWVITYVAGELPFYGSTWLSWWLDVDEDWLIKAAYYGPYFNGPDFKGFSTQVYTSFGPSETPHVRMLSDSGPGRGMMYLTLSGYLIDAAP